MRLTWLFSFIGRLHLAYRPRISKFQINKFAKYKVSVDAGIWLMVLICQILFYIYVDRCNRSYPEPRPDFNSSIYFSEGKARKYLHGLTSLGNRIVGSTTNQKHAVEYIWTELEKIRNGFKMKSHYLKMDFQTAKGSFDLNFLGGFTNVYENINNIIVAIVPLGERYNRSLLINCHYDTFLATQGASDDGVSCAMMLTVLNTITKRGKYVKNVALIFLFNGAEETILQGSHAFVTSHPWFSKVEAFINLEAAGAGGKELLFQAGAPWLLESYQIVPHPHASSLGQEIFQSGAIPSETDFRIFRDYGNIPGLDFAFVRNGYVYHTRHDTPDKIPPGCIQRAGENLLVLIWSIAERLARWTPPLPDQKDPVFFDLLGFTLVYVSTDFLVINNAILCFMFHAKLINDIYFARDVKASQKHAIRLFIGVCFIILSWIASLVIISAIAFFLDFIGYPMTWFNNTWLLVGLYAVPSLATVHFVMTKLKDYWLKEELLSHTYMESLISHSLMIIISTFLLWLSWRGMASSFIVFIFFSSMMFRMIIISFSNSTKEFPYLSLFIHLCPLAYHQLFSLYYVDGLITMFVPIMGRTGPSVPADLVIGILVSLITNYTFLCHLSLIFLVAIPKAHKIFFYTFMLFLFLATCTSCGFPFSSNPKYPVNQRVFIQHVQRKFNLPQVESINQYEDSYIAVIPLDRTGMTHLLPIKGLNFSDFKPLPCAKQPYCGWPYYLPLQSQMNQVFYHPSPKLEIMPSVEVKFDKTIHTPYNMLVNFTYAGPEYMSIYLSPCPGIQLVGWNIGNGIPVPTVMSSGVRSPQYFIFAAFGIIPLDPLWLNLTLVQSTTASLECFIQIAVVGHYMPMMDRGEVSSVLREYLTKMPDWMSVVHSTSTYESWTI